MLDTVDHDSLVHGTSRPAEDRISKRIHSISDYFGMAIHDYFLDFFRIFSVSKPL